MCVDRLEAGLKPACASACLAGALDFGVIETKPENRDQLQTKIPGFPSTDITHPNIRFQQTKSLPREMRRTDSMPLRYERDEQGAGEYKAKVDKRFKERSWGLSKLRSREDPLVIFTLVSQGVIGAFMALFLAPMFGMELISATQHPYMYNGLLIGLLGIESVALFLSTMHLGKPHRFYRAFNNLRYSPVSREVAGIAVFFNMLGAFTLLSLFSGWLPEGFVTLASKVLGWGAIVSGIAALYFMHKIYRIKARPFWNHWQVLSSFYGSMLSLGSLTAAMVSILYAMFTTGAFPSNLNTLAWIAFAGLLIESVGLAFHARDMIKLQGEGGASFYVQTTKYAYTYVARNLGLLVGMVMMLGIAWLSPVDYTGLALWSAAALVMLATAVVGRALFYVLVIPTTMPGAFFWRNKGFEEHARETGLAKMPQVGVLSDVH
jgi:DMSO reductase anchor subunit